MRTYQLENILGLQDPCTRRSFMGVFPSDIHVTPRRKKEFIVFNLDGHLLEGSHWVAVVLEKKNSKHYQGEYFDSFGRRPQNINIIKYLNKYCKKKLDLEYSTSTTQVRGYMWSPCYLLLESKMSWL